jgi:Ca-activated chloride channel family protein
MFEIKPVSDNIDSLNNLSADLANVTVNYKIPGDSFPRNSYFRCPFISSNFSYLPSPIRFAGYVTIFGEMLRRSKFTRHMSWNDLIEESQKAADPNNNMEKEFVTLVQTARKIYRKEKRK